MRQDFTDIINKLKTDPLVGISVYSITNLKQLTVNKNAAYFIAKYGSIENFFNKIKEQGHTEIVIQETRKNGSGYKRIGKPLNPFNFSDKKESASNFSNSKASLGFVEASNEFLQRDFDRLSYESQLLKIDNENLKTINAELKESILKDKYDADKSKKSTDMLKELVPLFAPMLQGMMSGSAGLNSPAPQQENNNLSQTKKQLQQMLQQANFSDAIAQFLIDISLRLNDEVFYEKLEALINEQV